jgi:hypothetical protein
MDQSCPVVHKIRRPKARLQTAKIVGQVATFSQLMLPVTSGTARKFLWPYDISLRLTTIVL